MSDYSELKRLATAASEGDWSGAKASEFMAAANPAAVLELIAELTRVVALNHEQFGMALRKNQEVADLKAENKRLAELLECSQGDMRQANKIMGRDMKDAERMRWLRTNEFDIGSFHDAHEYNHKAWFEHFTDESIDEAIALEADFAAESGQ